MALALALALLVGGAACSPDGPDSSRHTVFRDSAGIPVVVSEAPAWGPGEGWSLSPEPLLDLGGVDAPAAEQFGDVEDVALLPDGSVVVADGGVAEVRVFGPDGTHRATLGRRGEGPGEFGEGRLSLGILGADTVAVHTSGRVTRFLIDGTELGGVSQDVAGFTRRAGAPPARDVHPVEMGSDWLVAAADALRRAAPGPGDTDRSELHVVVADPGLERLELIGPFTGRRVGGRDVLYSSPTVFTVTGDRPAAVVIRPADAWELRRYALDGTLEWIARPALRRRPPGEGARSHLVSLLAETAPSREAAEARFEQAFTLADTLPMAFTLHGDPGGRVWIPDPLATADPGAPRFLTVVDAHGAWLGAVDVPFRVDPTIPLDVAETRLAVVEADDLEVEHVRVYEIRRPPS